MSLSIPITGIASSAVYRLHKLAPFDELTREVSSPQFPDGLRGFLEEHLGAMSEETDLGAMNTYYDQEIDRLLQLLPEECAARNYLALEKDFAEVKRIFLSYKEQDKSLSEVQFASALNEMSSRIVFKLEFRHHLLNRQGAMCRAEDIFSLIAYIEESFLTILYDKLQDKSEFYLNLVKARINTYTFMTAIKRMERGQAKEHILDHTLPLQGVPAIIALKSFTFGDLVGEIGTHLTIAPNEISVSRIETELLNREIQTINNATYLGMGDERVIQYTAHLYYFLSNLKLGYFQKVFQGNEQETNSRMINYNLH